VSVDHVFDFVIDKRFGFSLISLRTSDLTCGFSESSQRYHVKAEEVVSRLASMKLITMSATNFSSVCPELRNLDKRSTESSDASTERPKTTQSAVRGEAENHTSDWNPASPAKPSVPWLEPNKKEKEEEKDISSIKKI
jgi:hypothetical protein